MTASSDKTRVAAIYNPQNQNKQQLIDGFVVRQQIFQKLFNAIKDAKMEVPEQHYLILGRRGMGKTTLLLRLAYEIENDAALNTWLIPVIFNEEEYGIRSLFKFWERIMEELEAKKMDFRFSKTARKRLSDMYKDDDAYERALFEILADELKHAGKKIIIFVDNFGDMASKLKDEEAHRLRKILQTSADIRIIAASALVMESFYSYEHPFYEFFKVQELNGLDARETRELLIKLSDHYKKEAVARIVEQHPGRVEALRRITGGVIRTMVLLFEIFADDDNGSAYKDLEIILDRATPLYKHRMDDLSDQQQAIVEVIALHWDAISVKEITERTRLESKTVSAQLQLLEKNGIIEKRPTKTKNHLYLIHERFFNIWFLMRLGRRSDEKRVLWLVRFFEEWCDGDMMKSRAERHRLALKKGVFDPEAALHYSLAMVHTGKLNDIEQYDLVRETRRYLSEQEAALAGLVPASKLELIVEGIFLWEKGQKETAVEKFDMIYDTLNEKEDGDVNYKNFKTIQEKVVYWESAMPNITVMVAVTLKSSKNPDHENIKKILLYAINLGNPIAFNLLGIFLVDNENNPNAAIQYFQDGAFLGNIDCIRNLGLLYENHFSNFDIAIKYYAQGASLGDFDCINDLGILYVKKLNNINKAIECFKHGADLGSPVCMNNLGVIYKDGKNDLNTAIKWFERAAKTGDNGAAQRLGIIYLKEKNDPKLALEWYKRGVLLDDIKSMNNLAWAMFITHNEKETALDYVSKTISLEPDNNYFIHTAACIYAWNNQVGKSKDLIIHLLQGTEHYEHFHEETALLFTLLLAKNEAPWLYALFSSPEGEAAQLKDRFKPVYYAILKRLDHPDFLRMGDELSQTVDEIIAKAEQMAVEYA